MEGVNKFKLQINGLGNVLKDDSLAAFKIVQNIVDCIDEGNVLEFLDLMSSFEGKNWYLRRDAKSFITSLKTLQMLDQSSYSKICTSSPMKNHLILAALKQIADNLNNVIQKYVNRFWGKSESACLECGNKVNEGAMFCEQCGKKLKQDVWDSKFREMALDIIRVLNDQSRSGMYYIEENDDYICGAFYKNHTAEIEVKSITSSLSNLNLKVINTRDRIYFDNSPTQCYIRNNELLEAVKIIAEKMNYSKEI